MTGNIISWFDTTIDRFEELKKFIYNHQKYYDKPPSYVSIPVEDYFSLMRDLQDYHPEFFLMQVMLSSQNFEYQYKGIPIKASDIIRHGVMTDIYHQSTYKKEK